MTRRHLLRSCAVALITAACATGAHPHRAASDAADSALPPGLDLSDDVLFAGTLPPRLTAQLLDSRFVGVALRAPASVDLDRRSSLPLLVASRFDGARGWALPFDELAQLVAVEQRTGMLRVQPAFGSSKRAAAVSRGARPAPDELRGFGAQLTSIDARSRLALPWQAGCWAIRLIYHDWVSNPALVRLQSGQQPAATACPAPSTETRVEFKLARKGAAVRVTGRFVVPLDALGGERTALAATVLMVTPNDGVAERVDWHIPIAPAAGAPSVSGAIDQELPLRMTTGAQVYLVLAGQVHGPQPRP